MQVSHGELRPLDVHRQIHFAAARQVLDVAVPAVLRTAGDRSSAFLADAGLHLIVGRAGVHALRLRRLRHDTRERRGRDQLSFALVPFRQDLRGWSAPQDARVDETREADTRNVSRRAEDAFEVPDGFGTVRTE